MKVDRTRIWEMVYAMTYATVKVPVPPALESAHPNKYRRRIAKERADQSIVELELEI